MTMMKPERGSPDASDECELFLVISSHLPLVLDDNDRSSHMTCLVCGDVSSSMG